MGGGSQAGHASKFGCSQQSTLNNSVQGTREGHQVHIDLEPVAFQPGLRKQLCREKLLLRLENYLGTHAHTHTDTTQSSDSKPGVQKKILLGNLAADRRSASSRSHHS